MIKLQRIRALLISASTLKDNGWRDHTSRNRNEVLLKHLWDISENTELKTQLQLSRSNDEMAGSLSKDEYDTDTTQAGLSDAVLALNPERDSELCTLEHGA